MSGGICGLYSAGSNFSSMCYLDTCGAEYCYTPGTDTTGKSDSNSIKAMAITAESGLAESWTKNSSINNGYPYLKVFDDTSIWLRNSEINDGDPYLKDNPPQS